MGRRLAAAGLLMLALSALAASHADAALTYRGALRLATHNGRLFNFETWDAKIIWHATFFSDVFREHYAQRHIDRHHLDDLEAAQFIDEQNRRQARGWDFFVSFYTKKDYKKFSMDHDSFWKIRLTTASGEVVEPEAIDPIPITPYELVMYPHLNRWSKGYRVTFPKVPMGDEFRVTIQSVVGSSTLGWKTHELQPRKRDL